LAKIRLKVFRRKSRKGEKGGTEVLAPTSTPFSSQKVGIGRGSNLKETGQPDKFLEGWAIQEIRAERIFAFGKVPRRWKTQ